MSNLSAPHISVNTLVSKPMLERIIQATCVFYGVPEKDLIEGTASDIKNQKHLCWYLIKENVVISAQGIANRFKISDASTVRRAIDKIQAHKNIYAQTLHDSKKITELANTLV